MTFWLYSCFACIDPVGGPYRFCWSRSEVKWTTWPLTGLSVWKDCWRSRLMDWWEHHLRPLLRMFLIRTSPRIRPDGSRDDISSLEPTMRIIPSVCTDGTRPCPSNSAGCRRRTGPSWKICSCGSLARDVDDLALSISYQSFIRPNGLLIYLTFSSETWELSSCRLSS